MAAALIYILCALTSAACTVLLLRRYRHSRVRMLFWSALAFLAFAVSNVLLFIDLVVLPQWDLTVVRSLATLCGILLLLYGLIVTATKP
jgi:hydrogenase/urease accessory protein HupE